MALVDYACGHSRPVRGTGGTAARPCPDCERGYRKATGLKLTLSRIIGPPPVHYCATGCRLDEDNPEHMYGCSDYPY
jgi:hypothetical protein